MNNSGDPLKEARRLRAKGQHLAADRFLRDFVTTEEAGHSLLAEYAGAATDRCDWPEAAARWRRALETSPGESSFVITSRVHRHLRDFAQAEEIATAGLAAFPSSERLLAERRRARAADNGLSPYPPFEGEIARTYLEKRADKDHWRLEAEMIRQKLDAMWAQTVLDVPFGTGRFVADYLARGMIVTGADVSGDMFEAGREAMGSNIDRCRLVRASVANLPFPNRSFDLVVCLRLLPTNVDYGTALVGLAEMARVCSANILVDLKSRLEGADPVEPPRADEKMDARFSFADLGMQFAALGLAIVDAPVMRQVGLAEHRLFHLRPQSAA